MTPLHPRRTLLLGTLVSLLALASSASASPVPRHLYAVAPVNVDTSALVPFDVSATGQLSERASQSVTVPVAIDTVVVGRSGRFVYVGAADGYDDNDDDVPGAIRVYSVADDGSLTLLQTVDFPATQLALAPDGTRLFSSSNSTVVSFPILSDGSLGAAQANPAVTGYANAVAVSPDGETLYASTYPQFVQQYAIAADGTLTARTFPERGTFGCWSSFLGITPDGSLLDAICYNRGLTLSLADHGLEFAGWTVSTWGSSYNVEDVDGRALYRGIWPNSIQQLKRLPDGSLDYAAPLISDTATVTGLAQDPAGTTLIAGTSAHELQTFAIAADGSLPSDPTSTIATTLNSLTTLVYAPDQPPVAALTATQDAATVHLDARASSAVSGTIARYDWAFGDGTTSANGGATASHHYAAAGDYVVRVTLTDSSGCSVAETFTGTMAACAGSADAAATVTVHALGDPVLPPVTAPVTPVVDEPITAVPTPTAGPSERPAQRAPATLVVPRSLTGTPSANGDRVRLSWTPAPGAPPSKRYLVEWSSLHSAHGTPDPTMRHVWTSGTRVQLAAARPGTTLHYAVFAYDGDGRLVQAGKTTIRIRR